MTPEQTARAIELLVESQQLMSKNLQTLFEITQQTVKDTARNARDIGTLTQRLDRLALIVDDYIRGLRNGH